MANQLSPRAEKKYLEDLLATRRRIDLLESEKSDASKLLKEVIDEEWTREKVLRDLLDGQVSEQIALPGIDETSERNHRIGAALRRAIEKVRSITGVSPETDPDRPELRPLPGGR